MYSAERESYYRHLLSIYALNNVKATLKHNGLRIRINIDTDSGIYYANNGQARIMIFGQFRH